jgi:hypothetical protein
MNSLLPILPKNHQKMDSRLRSRVKASSIKGKNYAEVYAAYHYTKSLLVKKVRLTNESLSS